MAAANAIVCFEGYSDKIMAGEFSSVDYDLTSVDGFFDVAEASGKWDNKQDICDYVDQLTDEQVTGVIDGFSNVAEKMIEMDALPIQGRKFGCSLIWEEIKNTIN